MTSERKYQQQTQDTNTNVQKDHVFTQFDTPFRFANANRLGGEYELQN